MNLKQKTGPDPAVMEAIQRLIQTELDPLEEVIFNSWMQANQLEETPDQPFDYRGLYKQTDGKVFAPGELESKVAKQSAIEALMQAQEAHDSQSPMQMFLEKGGDPASFGGNSVPPEVATPEGGMPAEPQMSGEMMNSMMGRGLSDPEEEPSRY
jgi:hypothetical protein